ncbi:hypothetical protein EC991_010889 [Linnemannia zychae]|nr:hypothetical protein EC991_010889 [Linnemannia zychae]
MCAFGSDPRPGLFSTASTTQQQLPYIPRTQPTSSNDNSHRPGLGGFAYGSNTNLSSNGAYGPGEELEMMMGQMMQDPTFAQFMSSMLQNPQILESMIATNPMLQAMLGPDMGRRVLQSPQFLQMVASPDALQQVAQSISRSASSTPMTATTTMNTGGNTNVSATHSPTSTSTTPLATTPPPSSAPGMRLLPSSLISANAPEKRFQVQLQQLSEMGFWDPTKNMRALQVTGGDVNSAIEILCSGV